MTEPPKFQYVPLPPVNTYAILAAVFAFVVFPPLGIYFGRKAKEQIAQSGERGIELANVGIIAGWIISVLYGLFMIVWCGVAGTMVWADSTELTEHKPFVDGRVQ